MPGPKSDDKQSNSQPAGERARDEEREGGARYGGGPWEVADERGEQRYGRARNDDADPLEQIQGDPEIAEADGRVESSGEHEGIGRGEKPRKPKSRTKRNPQANTKTKRHR